MPDLQTEQRHLAQADRDLFEGGERISAQVLLIGQMRERGHGTDDAERLLLTLRQTLRVWQDHRSLSVQAIATLEGAARETKARPGALPLDPAKGSPLDGFT